MKQKGIVAKAKKQAGLRPVRLASGTGNTTVGGVLQNINPDDTQVQYVAPEQMSLGDAQNAIQGLYGKGQDYSDELNQIAQLQGQIRPMRLGDHLIDFGARLAGSQKNLAGAFGDAMGGSYQDGRKVDQQNLQNTMMLMQARQRIQAAQQARADEMAGKSIGYAQQQNQDRLNAAKTQYDVASQNMDRRDTAIDRNNRNAVSTASIMGNELQVGALKQQAMAQLAAETDPAKRALLQSQIGEYDNALKQIHETKQSDVDLQTQAENARADHKFGQEKQLLGMRLAAQRELANPYSLANQSLSPDSEIGKLATDAIGRNAIDALMTGNIQKPGGKAGADVFNATQQRMAMIANKYGITPDQLAQARSSYKANDGSLRQLQKQSDAVDAFEGTAGKNLDLFVQQAKRLVDTGSPLLNKPLRSIDRSALGKEDQLLYDTAKEIATNEIAKITSSANAGSGVLSDAARNEAKKYVPDTATLGATLKLAALLKQDMRNRHDSYQDQMNTIHNRIWSSGGPGMVKMMQDLNPGYAQQAPAAAPTSGTTSKPSIDDLRKRYNY